MEGNAHAPERLSGQDRQRQAGWLRSTRQSSCKLYKTPRQAAAGPSGRQFDQVGQPVPGVARHRAIPRGRLGWDICPYERVQGFVIYDVEGDEVTLPANMTRKPSHAVPGMAGLALAPLD